MQRAAGNRAARSLIARLAATPSDGPVAVQRAFELCGEADVEHGEDHRAQWVRAKNIKGKALGAAANSPTVPIFGWNDLMTKGHTLANPLAHSSHYNAVRMHLMNGRLGGPGDRLWNLAPGPAPTNSQMSAGPENSAKLLVDAGYTVWLETKVGYMNHSTSAQDFTSVVPNRIEMRWGAGTPFVGGSTWQAAIPLPVDPLQGADAQRFRQWDSAKTAELVAELKTQSEQVRAQVFDLVQHDSLRWAILLNFPTTYLSLERETKGNILKVMDDTTMAALFASIGVDTNATSFVEQIILPLNRAGESARLQKLFTDQFGRATQRELLVSFKLELVQALGPVGAEWSKEDPTIFRYNSPKAKAKLLASMTRNEIKTLFKQVPSTRWVEFLKWWAEYVGGKKTPADMLKFINAQPQVAEKYKAVFAVAMKKHAASHSYMAGRPKRGVKATVT
ncbi:MAG TPA: hypothetical protein VFJ85_08045 [Acidimicrobiales bacterium]|nr:hypothetical protein [Acidimicrobiales bacterium]